MVAAKASIWFAKGDKFRLSSLTVGGQSLAIVVVSDRAGFGQLNDAADELIKTLRFHP
jgi:hypothetical protein